MKYAVEQLTAGEELAGDTTHPATAMLRRFERRLADDLANEALTDECSEETM